MEKKTKRNIGLVLMGTILLAFLFFIQENKKIRIQEIERNSYGKGKKNEILKVTADGEKMEDTFEIEVHEQIYGERELQAVFGEVMDRLPQIILGENKSLDHVEEDLNLVTTIPEQAIGIQWESNRSDILNSRGEIQRENLSKEGELVELQAVLTYGKEEALCVINAMVFPKKFTEKEALIEEVKDRVITIEEKSREKETLELPKEVGGKLLIWERKKEYTGFWILMLGTIASMLLWIQEKQKKQKEKVMREEQMQMDYPEIVNKIALLVGAGLTVKNAWKKILDHYEEQTEEKKRRFAYDEMENAMREMQGGVTEAECYEHFGRRTGLPSYVKLGTLLSQNLRKGTKGLTDVLSREAVQAYEERRQMIKKRGEEVSTKLLLPMSMMLVVVLVIVIVPAFLSIPL